MAKCGTSSLSRYLQQHPDVFISARKEPRFLTSQCHKFPENGPKDHLVKKWYVKNFEEYAALFENAEAKAIGEASADTLYFYKDTIPVIKKYLGEPKIIIILRNPVKRAFSGFQHLVRDDREFLPFEEALMEEQKRIKENWELIYHYKEASRYYEPVKAFLEAFPNVKILLTEDLNKHPQKTLDEIFDFLNLEPVTINTEAKFNISGKPKSRILHKAILEDSLFKKAVIRPLARMFFKTKESRGKVINWVWRKNMERLQIPVTIENQLYEEFRDDTLKTEKLIGRDLSFWRRGPVA